MAPCTACSVCNLNFHSVVPQIHHRATRPLERVYLDFFIPPHEAADASAGVVLAVLDEATRYLWMHVAPTRVAAVTWFQQLIAKMERQADKKLVTVITDNAPEFISGTFQQFLGGLGIEHLYSVPHETTHNGPVERVFRTLVSMTRQLLADGALPVRLWPHAARHAAYLYNR